ncbi:hypothetical protein BJ875DRAFT_165068 [Amylocarpus encephaloides]|uniref:Zn(2)-C6 fungal-type domain-containing protein n=1 Tax=Amylocarpus encephaloides TaxID=45428 RepID=A0A9P8C8E1_9HELO|nr:hypothetical protein BJ875DRAFT_165068 [Amylocarpus encephaloides]
MANQGNPLPPLAIPPLAIPPLAITPLATGPVSLVAATSATTVMNLAMTSNPGEPVVGQRPARPPPPPLDSMRAYRACLNCRNRKSKCDLDINGGRPPCRRCQREGRDCVLGESHRGGRRVRKKPKLEESDDKNKKVPTKLGFQGATSSIAVTPSGIGFSYSAGPSPSMNPLSVPQTPQPPATFQNPYIGRTEQTYTWPPLPAPTTTTTASDSSRNTGQTLLSSPPIDPALRTGQESTHTLQTVPMMATLPKAIKIVSRSSSNLERWPADKTQVPSSQRTFFITNRFRIA